MSDHSNNTNEDPASSEGRRPTSSNRANSSSQHRSEDEDQDNAHTPPSPSAFIWGGPRHAVSLPASNPPRPNSDRRGDISLTSAPNRRTGGNSSSATGAYSSSSTLAYNPQMSQHNARPANYQHGPNSDYRGDIFLPSAQDRRTEGDLSSAMGACSLSSTQAHSPRMSQHNTHTRMDHPASSSTGPSSLPAENGRASRPYSPEGRQSKRQRRELDDNVGSAELNTETNKSSPDRQQRAKVTTPGVGSSIAFRPINKAWNSQPVPASSDSYPSVGSSIAFRPINKASNSQPVPAPSESYAQAANNRVSKRVRPNKQSSSRGVPGRKRVFWRAHKYADSGRCTTCGELLPSNNSSSPRCDECRRKDREKGQAKRAKGTEESGQKRKRRPKRMLPAQRWQDLTPPTRNRRVRKTMQMEWSSQNGGLQMMERMTLIWMELHRSSWLAYDLGHGLRDEEC
ncbi:hypothetical protein NCU08569 [Neurospora crassa OR74A]|uniref:Uncharacterized protein n=1 Tax=Neurospora crassa (strain ATCC 24698 / 74-OR23-1A / CBS 708.71 / DSM 1257 / FGSC 987) TaxID=367110 RepID=Q7SB26_NEUCR|nr:hypothetical protein NCU08569 [Neurospora crassa OR74A]EAA33595.2 hypothetical protein NCU08569 [Neurospora crassa OR74A]|eukprot:XP_962831.2 hypothetical protein NCU08569 [Neurospora crassa OR74A]